MQEHIYIHKCVYSLLYKVGSRGEDYTMFPVCCNCMLSSFPVREQACTLELRSREYETGHVRVRSYRFHAYGKL